MRLDEKTYPGVVFMQELLNEAIIPMLNDGLISMRRVSDLISIKGIH